MPDAVTTTFHLRQCMGIMRRRTIACQDFETVILVDLVPEMAGKIPNSALAADTGRLDDHQMISRIPSRCACLRNFELFLLRQGEPAIGAAPRSLVHFDDGRGALRLPGFDHSDKGFRRDAIAWPAPSPAGTAHRRSRRSRVAAAEDPEDLR